MAKLNFRPLRADEIDVRVGTVSKAGVTLLLYKDARCDQNVLDETVGPFNWQRHHSRDNANCVVAIWDEEKKQWIEKEDTGTESFTEKEKGLASDSFKRACFNWGIGRELYTAPFVFVKCETEPKGNGWKLTKEGEKAIAGAKVDTIEYADGKITQLSISGRAGNLFSTGKTYSKPKEDLTAVAPDLNAIAPEREIAKLQGLCAKYGVDIKEIGKASGATSLLTMTNAQVGKAMEILRAYGN